MLRLLIRPSSIFGLGADFVLQEAEKALEFSILSLLLLSLAVLLVGIDHILSGRELIVFLRIVVELASNFPFNSLYPGILVKVDFAK